MDISTVIPFVGCALARNVARERATYTTEN